MISRLSNLTGPFSSFSRGSEPRLMLSLDSFSYEPVFATSFTFDILNSVTNTSNSVTSTANGWGNSKATSVETIPIGKPFRLKFKRGESLGNIMCGVSQNPPINSSQEYHKLSFGFYVGSTTGDADSLSVVERDDYNINYTNSPGAYPSSTVYTIIYDGVSVNYYVDESLFYTSESVPTGNLFLYIIFNDSGKSITDLEFGSYTIWEDLTVNNRDFNLINYPNHVSKSFYFNGDSQYATGSELGALRKFTIDTWFNLKSLPSDDNYPQIITNKFVYDSESDPPFINFAIGFIAGPQTLGDGVLWDGKISAGFFGPSAWQLTDGFTPELNVWYNAVFTYESNSLKFYLNGDLYSSSTSSTVPDTNGNGIYIGRRWDNNEFIDGNIDIVNIWNGPLTSTQISDNYNNIKDRYLTTDSSILLNGYTNWLEIPKSNDWLLGNTYTIEFWSKAATSSSNAPCTIMSQYPSDTNIDIFYLDGKLYVNNSQQTCPEPTPGVWTHVAIVSATGSLTVFYDGVATYSGSGNYLNFNSYGLAIGRRGPTNNFQYFNGELYGIRINNHPVYTSEFDPYSVALPMTDISGTVLLIDKYQPYISEFIDTSRRHNITSHGATYSSDIPTLPTGSLQFGTSNNTNINYGGYLGVSASTDLTLGTGSFTVEWWQNINTYDLNPVYGNPTIFSFGSGISPFSSFFYNNGGTVSFFLRTSNVGDRNSEIVSDAGTWSHYAITRDNSNTIRAFQNGIKLIENNNDDSHITNDIYIGANPGFPAFTMVPGYISNFHIIKGSVKYVSNFTPSLSKISATQGTVLLLNNVQNSPFADFTGKTVSVFGTVSYSPNSPFS